VLQREEFLIRELLETGVIDAAAVDRATAECAEHGAKLLDSLVTTGAVTARDLAIASASIFESCFVGLEQFEIDLSHAERLPRDLAERFCAFPLFVIGDRVTVGMADPMDFRAVDQLRQRLRAEIHPVACEPDALRRLITRAYSLNTGTDRRKAESRSTDLTTGEEPIVVAVNEMIASAIEQNASDIHLGADDASLHLRYRVDGVLRPQQGPPKSAHDALVRRFKVMAQLDLTQTRKPQDGKIRFTHHGQAFDLRVSVIPTVNGESVVVRVLRPTNTFSSLDDLGMDERSLEVFDDAIGRPNGMILVTGPTGSGKTTTLYTALQALNTPDRNIMTIEDPVEIRLPMLRQTQVNSGAGLTFATALRSILRQDPDVVLVGEIRDEETAHIAVQASLTGHLVLSTLHTNDAVGAVQRLRDLGAEPFAINSALLCVVAQRLVRRVCERCAQPAPPTDAERRLFGITTDGAEYQRGAGCERCLGSGYRGRVGVYEVLRISPDIQQAIHDERSPSVIREIARRDGMRLMLADGLDKARRGLTTLEELVRLRATVDEDADASATSGRAAA
jgi:type IV pilus assembly protein PilB